MVSFSTSNISGKNRKLVLCFLVLVIIILIISFYFIWKAVKTSPQKPEAPPSAEVKPKEEPKENGIDLSRKIFGRVESVDQKNKTLEFVTLDSPSKTYQVRITDQTVIRRPAPTQLENQEPNTNSAFWIEKFTDLRQGSVLVIITKENPNDNNNLTAIFIDIVV